MDRRHQVFVSSTFDDLEEGRQEVATALLKSECFPAGMELFPAVDLEQFEYIKQVISESDYFLIVSAGRYGSIHPGTGLSYTEMEYDFALEMDKPIIRLLHKDPFTVLPGELIERTDKGKKKLRAFREKLKTSRMVSFWTSPKDLGQQTTLAIVDIRRRRPSPGWVRGENALTIEVMRELEALRSAAAMAATQTAGQLVNFEDLVKQTEVPIMVASSDDEDAGEAVGVASIDNKLVAEAVFLVLISNHDLLSISRVASDVLTERFSFAKKYHGYQHRWLELPPNKVEYFLHYLESRGLVRGPRLAMISHWELTSKGRAHATFLSSLRNLG